jgi:hypothetical protein
MPEITIFTHDNGPLTKRFELASNGNVIKSTAARMCNGVARRAFFKDLHDLAGAIAKFTNDQAHSHGKLRHDLPNEVRVTTKRKLNGAHKPDLIARTKEFLDFSDDGPVFILFDFDGKGMPGDMRARIDRAGGLWSALCQVIPELATTGRLVRGSTSAGIYRDDTREVIEANNNTHFYIIGKNGRDAVRFLKVMHDRCWLAGYGWYILGRSGQLLERSIIDRMVGSPERLNFEGPPQLERPLVQHPPAREPKVMDGDVLDTVQACPPLTTLEKTRLTEIKAKAKQPLINVAAKARAAFVHSQAEELANRKGISHQAATETIAQMGKGVLRPDIVLEFDDSELAGTTVADVLADPEKYADETLADPLERAEYGLCKAMIMVRDDGIPWIHSFAHGRTAYELKYDCAAIRAALNKAPQDEVINTLIKLMHNADMSRAEEETLVAVVQKRTDLSIRSIKATLKNARQEAERERKEAAKQRRLAERDDPRPILQHPQRDAPWLPVMDAINQVLGTAKDRIPPARNMEGKLACVRKIKVKGMHAFTDANDDGEDDGETAPQWIIHEMSGEEIGELIERHIDFVDLEGRSIHLAGPFVGHYEKRSDDVLPTLAAISALPIVSANGDIIYADGLDRKRGIIFNVHPSIMKLIPTRSKCTPYTVGEAMAFLTDEWLVDVATDYTGKCVLIALALTLAERSLMENRPAWWVTAGRRGSGKTTVLMMIIEAITGMPVSASAWSPSEEERRKALLSYLATGVPYILWDNITRGSQLSCPHIEKACTSSWYSDRKLGVSELIQTAAATIHCFTGNNVWAKGDLASRSLSVRLDVNQLDPENRDFKHPDPLGWTRTNRPRILAALYTILIGNPKLNEPRDAPMKTRFKMWYRLVGSDGGQDLCLARGREVLAIHMRAGGDA